MSLNPEVLKEFEDTRKKLGLQQFEAAAMLVLVDQLMPQLVQLNTTLREIKELLPKPEVEKTVEINGYP